jgi:hypothetical protein
MDESQRRMQKLERDMQLERLRQEYATKPGMPYGELEMRRQQRQKAEDALQADWNEQDRKQDEADRKAAADSDKRRLESQMEEVTRRSQERARNERLRNEGRL